MSKLRYRHLAIVYCIIILLVSSIPGRALVNIKLLSMDKLLHMIEYSILGWLLVRSLEQKLFRSVIIVMLIGIVFGAFDEIWQLTVSGRSAHIYDWFADLAGVMLGSTVALLIPDKIARGSTISR